MATEMRCLRKADSRLSPVTAEVRRPSSATKCRARSPHEPNVSKARGMKVWVAARSAYFADFSASYEEAVAQALAAVA